MLRCFVFIKKTWIFVADSFVFTRIPVDAKKLPLSGELAKPKGFD